MRLTDKAGKDVENFGNKMAKMARCINITGSAPIELSIFVAKTFTDFEVLALHLKATGLHDLADRNPKALYADDIIRTLQTKFWSLQAQGLCSPPERNKLYMEGNLAGLNLVMKKLVE